ncbi:MAG: adenosylcobinamide-GDP ribazoletransferase [Spirochaetes bacterium]|nr:adenosylcobinamide-GDP ribazoletransferase [Spirochaetota bacterium]
MGSIRKIKNSILTVIGLLSRVPVPVSYTPDFSLFPLFMPLIGLLFALFLSLPSIFLIQLLRNSAASAGLILLFQYLMFNIFHFDGLLDSADALLYRTTMENRLRILKDKSAGSFALFTGALYILVKFNLVRQGIVMLQQTVPAGRYRLFLYTLLFLFLPAGRIAGGMVPALTSPARSDGLGFQLKDFNRKLFITGSIGTITVSWFILFFLYGKMLPADYTLILSAAFAGALLAGVFTALVYKRKVGGFTGDAVGMAIELGELVYLLVVIEFIMRQQI